MVKSSSEVIAVMRVLVLSDIEAGTRVFELENITELGNAHGKVLDNQYLKLSWLTTATQADELVVSNFPNPFQHSTTINYYLPEAGRVSLVVYNSMGQAVSTLVEEYQSSGTYQVNHLDEYSQPGAYYYRLVLIGERRT
ncbi:T9SS type A sorting domain-containing protein, partial [Arthrospira platensis SPKY2]